VRVRTPYVAVRAAVGLARCLARTWRVRVVAPHDWFHSRQPWPTITPLWHNRILILADLIPRAIRERSVALASASRDGEVAAQVLRAVDFGVVRGSTSRRGHEALYGLKRALLAGKTVAMTVDGPRGPRYHVHSGAVFLAEWTGVPLLPVGFNAPRRWELRGWDGTQIPKPFSRVTLVFGEFLAVAPDLTPEQRAAECARVRERLLLITNDLRAGHPPADATPPQP
jgi:hypothetical protein